MKKFELVKEIEVSRLFINEKTKTKKNSMVLANMTKVLALICQENKFTISTFPFADIEIT